MTKINDNYSKLPGSYLFSQIARRVAAFSNENPGKSLIRLGIGDVTRPLAPAVITAMHNAVDEMGDIGSFRGYGPDHRYEFFLDAIIENDYNARGVTLARDEVFLSDGAKSDCANDGAVCDRHSDRRAGRSSV